MKKKDTLYTVNKWNQPLFGDKNLFWPGGELNTNLQLAPTFADVQAPTNLTLNPNLLENIQLKQMLGNGNSGINGSNGIKAGNILGTIGTAVSPILSSAIGGGYSTGGVGEGIAGIGNAVGNAVGGPWGAAISAGSSILGGLTNRAFGTKENKGNIDALNANIAAANLAGNALAGSTTSSDFFNNTGLMTNGTGFGTTDLVKGGWFAKGKARRKGQKYLDREANALAMQNQGMVTGANNVDSYMDDAVMSNFAAFGGTINGALDIMQNDKYIDAINNRTTAIAKANPFTPYTQMQTGFTGKQFDGGGSLEAAFLDNFKTNPLGAVMQYNRGLEAMAAQREAEKNALAQQAAYEDMQNRLMAAETNYQSLQSLYDEQARSLDALRQAQIASQDNDSWREEMIKDTQDRVETASNIVKGAASKDKNWNYIEKKLRDSGKFNDIQIEGIRLNLQRESGFNPNAIGDSGKALGLGQWHPDRQPKDKSMDGQINHLINTLSAFDGTSHWIGRGNYNGFLNARTPEEAHYYIAKGYERPRKDITDNLRNISDMSLRKRAFGGELGTNGTDWTNGLLYVDEGGTHEENPMDGVPMGVDAEGVPNLVEEGETVFNDYVFSHRMDVPAFMHKELGLGGGVKKSISFAEASKKLAKESEQRPNDPISKAGLEASLSKLAEVQEAERMKMRAEVENAEMEGALVAACGGKLGKKYAEGGKKGKTGLNTYAFDPIDQFKYWNKDTKDYDSGYRDFIENKLNEDWINRVMKGQYGDMSRYLGANNVNPTIAQARTLGLDTLNSDWHKAMALAYDDYLKGIDPLTGVGTSPEFEGAANRLNNLSPLGPNDANHPQGYWGPGANDVSYWEAAQRTGYTGLPATDWQGNATGENPNQPIYVPAGSTSESVSTQAPLELASVAEERNKTAAAGMATEEELANAGRKRSPLSGLFSKDDEGYYPTWMRYAPAVGAGMMAITDALGLTNKPDYTYANKLEAAAEQAGYAPNITPSYIGDYIRYQPMDIWAEQNRLNANTRATDRALINNSAPVGTRAAGLLANEYNNQIGSGELYRKALEYNDAKRQQVADFNRRTNMFNTQMGLEAAMANARYNQQARQYRLSGLAQAAAMRDAIDQRVGAARAANLTNLFDNLGNIGRENFALNQIYGSRAANNGWYSTASGKQKHSNACGGKMKKRK